MLVEKRKKGCERAFETLFFPLFNLPKALVPILFLSIPLDDRRRRGSQSHSRITER